MNKITTISFKGFLRLIILCIIILISFYFGWIKQSPVIVIVIFAGINTVLMLRLKLSQSWTRSFRKGFVMFFIAEIFCFIGLYLCLHNIFILVHDLFHIISFYFFFQFLVYLFDRRKLNEQCVFQCCQTNIEWFSDNCNLRNLLVGLLSSCVLLSLMPIGLWYLNKTSFILDLPEEVTELSQTLSLVVYSGTSLLLLLFSIFMLEFRKQLINKQLGQIIILAFALLVYSLFQLLISLLKPSVAIPVEEFLEFIPMVPIFYFLIGKKSR